MNLRTCSHKWFGGGDIFSGKGKIVSLIHFLQSIPKVHSLKEFVTPNFTTLGPYIKSFGGGGHRMSKFPLFLRVSDHNSTRCAYNGKFSPVIKLYIYQLPIARGMSLDKISE